MFTWLNKQGVKSDRGFIVQRTGRFSAEYREKGRCITIDVESGISNGRPCIIIGPKAFDHWDDDLPNREIAPEQRKQLLENFKEAIEFQGLKMVVEEGE